MPGLINESAARNVAPDYRRLALHTNLFDSGLKRAAFSELLVTEPVGSVSYGEERKSIRFFNSSNGFYPQDEDGFRGPLLGNSVLPR